MQIDNSTSLTERSPAFHLDLQINTHSDQNRIGLFPEICKTKKDEIYALAYTLYQNLRYEDASHYFRLLVATHPSEAKFWKGLGACAQMQKDYEEALDCYCCCAHFCHQNQADPYLFVQTADCHFALKEVNEGLKALEAARSIAKKIGDTRVLEHVALMQQVWKK